MGHSTLLFLLPVHKLQLWFRESGFSSKNNCNGGQKNVRVFISRGKTAQIPSTLCRTA